MSLRASAAALQPDLVRLRRALHRHPEVGLHLPYAQRQVLAGLEGLPLELTTGDHLTSVVAVLRGTARVGSDVGVPSVLLRSDMDALAVTEATGVPFASVEERRMHACGHDLHTSLLVGAARLLSERRDQLWGDVVLMFQPGEEGHDGARLMIEEGVLEAAGPPIAAFALHVVATIPAGLFVTRRGIVLAGADVLETTVRGRGGHASSPQQAADPIPAACEMVTALQAFVTRSCDVFDPVVVTVSTFRAGSAPNVIPTEASFAATVRSLSVKARDRAKAGLVHLFEGIAAAHDLEVETVFTESYPVTVNDRTEAEQVAATIADVYGPERFAWAPNPIMASEDFSLVLARIPGAMVFLGACPPGRDSGRAASNHAPEATFDDAVLSDGAALLAELALRRLRAARAEPPVTPCE